jgi:hypothetical protein
LLEKSRAYGCPALGTQLAIRDPKEMKTSAWGAGLALENPLQRKGSVMFSTCLATTTQRLVALTFAVVMTVMTFPGFLYNVGQ